MQDFFVWFLVICFLSSIFEVRNLMMLPAAQIQDVKEKNAQKKQSKKSREESH